MGHKYARVERERRFLLRRLPEGIDPDDFRRLHDLYIRGTHLRLRRVERPDGSVLRIKLGQKLPDPDAPDDPSRRLMTNLYIGGPERALMEELPGLRTIKRRYTLAEQGRPFSIDVYEMPAEASQIVVAEVECPTQAELLALAIPAWAEREVTTETRFTGAAIAAMGEGRDPGS